VKTSEDALSAKGNMGKHILPEMMVIFQFIERQWQEVRAFLKAGGMSGKSLR